MEVVVKKGMLVSDFSIQTTERMSEEAFFAFSMQNPDLIMERDKHGNILIMPPVNILGARFESRAFTALTIWNTGKQLGEVFNSNAGFTLPNGAVRAPDVSWISTERMAALSREELEQFGHICPEFIIEVRSKSDALDALRKKMKEYIENDARLGFLIDPKEQQAFVYRADGAVETYKGLDAVLSGEPLLPGFSLPLSLFQMD